MTDTDSVAIEIAQLKMTTQHLATLVMDLKEGMEGTNRTRGMKEKLTIAELNIEANRQAYQEVMQELQKTEAKLGRSMFELSNSITIKLDEKFNTLQADNEAQNTAMQKIQPWVNVLAWVVTVAGGIIVSMFLNGRIQITP
jgi:hypothetical protein